MNLIESVSTCYKKYAVFSGRATRSEFWWYMLFYNVIVSVPLSFISPVLENAWSLANVVPALAVSARRLHDTDRTGWLQLLPLAALPLILAPLVLRGFDFLAYEQDLWGSPLFWAGAVLGVVLYIVLIVWYATQGTHGPNRYGDDPFNRTDATVFE